MKDGHLLSQHAVSGQRKRGRDGGGDSKDRVKRIFTKEEDAEGYVSVKKTDRERFFFLNSAVKYKS